MIPALHEAGPPAVAKQARPSRTKKREPGPGVAPEEAEPDAAGTVAEVEGVTWPDPPMVADPAGASGAADAAAAAEASGWPGEGFGHAGRDARPPRSKTMAATLDPRMTSQGNADRPVAVPRKVELPLRRFGCNAAPPAASAWREVW